MKAVHFDRTIARSLHASAMVTAFVMLAAVAGAFALGRAMSGPRTARRVEGSAIVAAPVDLTGNELHGAQWCGSPRSTDDLEHEINNGTHRFHAAYAIPSDGVDRFADLATQIQAEAFEASALLERDYGRAIRFDMGTDCGSQNLDVTILRLPQTVEEMEELAEDSDGTFDTIAQDVEAAGLLATRRGSRVVKNVVVWLDAPANDGLCGQSHYPNDSRRSRDNLSEQGGNVSVIYHVGSGYCGATVVRHELAHTLGAVPEPAPNAIDTHCNDAFEDTMCVPNSPSVTPESAAYFDYGNDDYWDPVGGDPLRWWTVNLSSFICDDTLCNHQPDGRSVAATGTASPARSAVLRLNRLGQHRVRVTVRCAGEVVRESYLALPARLKVEPCVEL